MNAKLAVRDFLKERPEWSEKTVGEDVIRAFEHMKNVDPRYPTVKDAVMAARCADVKALLTIKKNGFTKWDDPGIMTAASSSRSRISFPLFVFVLWRALYLGLKHEINSGAGKGKGEEK